MNRPESSTANLPLIDTCLSLETPEGVDLLLQPAGPFPRALALGLDLLARGLILLALALPMSALDAFGVGAMLIAWFLVNWWYMVLFEVFNQGRSPGKQLLRLRVIHADGTPVGWSASLLRNLLRVVDMLPIGYALGLSSCLANNRFARLGDLAANTLVVHEPPKALASTPIQAKPRFATLPLSLDEQKAILAFAERSRSLSPARADELAELLRLPLQIPDNVPAGDYLQGIAAGLIGIESDETTPV